MSQYPMRRNNPLLFNRDHESTHPGYNTTSKERLKTRKEDEESRKYRMRPKLSPGVKEGANRQSAGVLPYGRATGEIELINEIGEMSCLADLQRNMTAGLKQHKV